MADSGSGTGTPIQPGKAQGFNVAEPIKATLLSLPYYAQILGINPVFFQSATGDSIGVFPLKHNRDNDLWPRHSWQDSDRISREDLARAIYDAEQDIMRLIKYPPAPMWISQDVKMYPRFHRPDTWQVGAYDVRGAQKSVILDWGKLISPGQRNVSLIGTATTTGGSLAYTDEDGDGLAETATITLSTTETNACELKVYFSDTGGAQEWEIRPVVSKSISGGIFTAVFRSWLFIDPDIQAAYPTTDDFGAIDIGTVDNYVSTVDVYREYTDTSQASAVFYWEPNPSWSHFTCSSCGGSGCTACQLTTQNGCLRIRNAELGEGVPVPATYDADSESWQTTCFTVSRDPDIVKVYYYAGDLSNENLSGRTCEGLSNWWAQTISWLATARLERPFCSGANVKSLVQKWQQDLSMTGEVGFQVSEDDLSNPLGTRFGEVMAWRRIKQEARKRMHGVAV